MKTGKYQHFRNKQFYEVIGTAKHSETLEEMVIYKALYESDKFPFGQLWVRPKTMFLELVDHEGLKVPRFQPVEEE
jgi:hypothetical protein